MNAMERVEARRLIDGAAEGPAPDQVSCYACGSKLDFSGSDYLHWMNVNVCLPPHVDIREWSFCALCTDDLVDRIVRMRRTLGVK